MHIPVIMTHAEVVEKVREIRDNTPFFQEFSKKQIEELNRYFLWKYPEKFFVGDEEISIVAGRVRVNRAKRAMQLRFSNGYNWLIDFEV